METGTKELEILENIYNSSSHVSQRELARVAELSLGMTNTILKRLAQKGWITIRKLNNRNIRYAVTPEGTEVILKKSYRYFKRTVKNVVFYRKAVESLIKNVREWGYEAVLIVGRSDLDFLVEHACRHYGMPLLEEDPNPQEDEGVFYLYSENYIPDVEEESEGRAYLQKVLI
jgi:DNA-binding MarR family transcriptional regulator